MVAYFIVSFLTCDLDILTQQLSFCNKFWQINKKFLRFITLYNMLPKIQSYGIIKLGVKLMALFKKTGFDFDEYYKQQEREEQKRQDSFNNVIKRRSSGALQHSDITADDILQNNTKALEGQLKSGEKILKGFVPDKKAGIKLAIFGMLPFIIFWGGVDFGVLIGMTIGAITGGIPAYILGILYPFMAVHLTPVWIWIAGIAHAKNRYKYVNYFITNERVVKTRRGAKNGNRSIIIDEFAYLNRIKLVAFRQTPRQQKYGTGAITMLISASYYGKDITFADLQNAEEAYQETKQILSKYGKNVVFIDDPNEDITQYYDRFTGFDENGEYRCDDAFDDDEEEWDDSPEALLAADQEELEAADWVDEEVDEEDYKKYSSGAVDDYWLDNPNVSEENKQLLIKQRQRSAQMKSKLAKMDEELAKQRQQVNEIKAEFERKTGKKV